MMVYGGVFMDWIVTMHEKMIWKNIRSTMMVLEEHHHGHKLIRKEVSMDETCHAHGQSSSCPQNTWRKQHDACILLLSLWFL